MIKLSLTQNEIVSFDKGALLVEASAGSGKTRVLTERIKKLIPKTKRQILAITFTNKACEEIKNRLNDVDDFEDKVVVGTFHSFCQSIIEMRCSTLGYAEPPQVFSDENDCLKLVEDVLESIPYLSEMYNVKTDQEKRSFKINILHIISQIKREMILDEDLLKSGINQTDVEIYRNYRDLMKSLNVIDYDDLLYLTYILFTSNPSVANIYRKNFEYICVDEAQDLNRAQYLVLRTLVGDENKNIMLVGDPKQSIYGFNGSSSSFMEIDFVKDFSPKKIELKENYRSAKKILEYANKLMPKSSDIENVKLDGICDISYFPSPSQEAESVVVKIKELLASPDLKDIEGKLDESQISVIARNKYVLSNVEECLKQNNIPYYYKNSIKGLSLSSTYGKIFDLAMQVKINLKDSLHLRELRRFVAVEQNVDFIRLCDFVNDVIIKAILKSVYGLLDDGSNFQKQLKMILDSIHNCIDVSAATLNDEFNLALSDFDQIKMYWNKYVSNNISASLSQFRNFLALGKIVSSVEKNGVVLSTVHTMKGQESDVVFLIGLDDMTFPDYRAVQKGNDSFEMQQEKNDLYVAITRARRYLFISYPTSRTTLWGNTYARQKSRLLPM